MQKFNPIHQSPEELQANATRQTTEAVNATNETIREVSQDKATSSDVNNVADRVGEVVEAVKNIPPTVIPEQKEFPKELKMELTNKKDELASAFFSMLRGDKGDKGDKGDRGDAGEAIKGDTGDQGIQGEKGERGERGPKGEKGIKGDNGENGANGNDGEDGVDGSPDTGEQIVGKINPLRNVLDFRVLTNVPDFLMAGDIGQGGGGGGGQNIQFRNSTGGLISAFVTDLQFGSGITPTYSNGKITITASGGGGGHTIQDEGVSLTQRTNLNFVGTGVAVTDGGAGPDSTIVTINSAAASLAVGTSAITGGTATRVLFEGVGNVLQESAGFTFTEATSVLTISGTANTTIAAVSSNTTSTAIEINNTSVGGHDFTFFSTGSGNTPGNFGIYDNTSSKTLYNLNGTTGNVGILRDAVFTWSSDASFAQTSPDTGISRTAAGKLAIGNATAGDFSGSLIATGFEVGHATDTTITRASAGVIAVEGKNVYMVGGADVALADGGTGASLSDPAANAVMVWDDTTNAVRFALLSGLTYDSATNTLTGGAGGGATTALDNLASVAINTTLVSDTDNTDDIGTSAKFWRTGYFKTSIELGATDTTLTRTGAGAIAVEGIPVLLAGSTTVGQIPRITGSNTYAWGALDLADTDAVTGLLPLANLASKTERLTMMDWSMIPDVAETTGDAFIQPYSILATNDVFKHNVLILGRNNAAAPTVKSGVFGTFLVPHDFNSSGTTKVYIYWTSTLTSGDAVFDFDYRAITGNDSESYDQNSFQESVTVTDTAPGAANRQLITSVTLTSSNIAADDIIEYEFGRDGTDGADTLAGSAMVFKIVFEYQT